MTPGGSPPGTEINTHLRRKKEDCRQNSIFIWFVNSLGAPYFGVLFCFLRTGLAVQ